MLSIGTKISSHRSGVLGKKQTLKQLLASKPRRVQSFKHLIEQTAELSFHNPDHVLFFRGQDREYVKKVKGKWVPSFYPTIYRSPGFRLSEEELTQRFERLDKFTDRLRSVFKEKDVTGHEKLANFPEIVWAILQHYGACDTPLLDVTHSLRVAASFALDHKEDTGFVFVFGFPYPNASITYSVDNELLNVRLLSICPPAARRPFFQEGFLVGTFPSRKVRKHPSLDLNVRLIARYQLIREGFWDSHFSPIPHDALFPKEDEVEEICTRVRAEISAATAHVSKSIRD